MLYKCKNCGGELAYDPKTGKLKCKFCDSVYDLSEYEEAKPETQDNDISTQGQKAVERGFDKATDDTTDIQSDLVLYQCPNCGAEVVTDKSTAATNCVFCNTPLILQEQMTGTFKPDGVVPFEVDKSQIESLYENYIKDKPFYPQEYSTANVIEKIKAVYLPFWLYSFKTTGDLNATGERLRTITTRDWIITDHDVFNIYRAGQMNFNKVPVIASQKTPKDAMDSIEPYDYSKLKPFDTGYLPGFLAERYDMDANTCKAAANERAANTFDGQLSGTIGGYSNVKMQGGHMDHQANNASYTLMPAYLLFMDWKNDEDKLIAINGQTGKIVGNIPVDKRKRNRYFLKLFLLGWLILFVIAMAFFMLM